MSLARLTIRDFRCLREADITLDPRENYVFGPNASGKTSLLEATFFLGRGRSFRTHRLDRLIREGQTRFEVVGRVREGGREMVVGIRGARGGTEARVAGEPAPNLAALAEVLAVQAIDPDVHKLVEEGPEYRRQFLDWGVFHVKHGFLDAWRRYRRTLRQRNAALRKGLPRRAVASWDAEFLEAADALSALRLAYCETLAAPAERMTEALLGEGAALEYAPGWPAGTTLAAALEDSRERERELGRTLPGPHRADLKIRTGGKLARDRVSRGQQKLLAAALVLAQMEVLSAARQRPGVLLLDDPAAELDQESLGRLLDLVAGLDAQRLISGLDARGLAVPEGARTYRIRQGEVSEMV